MLLVGGTVSLVLAVVPLRSGDGTRLRVPPDTPVRLPSSGPFGTTLVLVGRTGGERPADSELGCNVTTADGHDVGMKVSTLAALGAGERTVGGQVLTPLATVKDFDGGFVLTCSGPAAAAAQPLYLLGDRRRAVPGGVLAGFGVTCLVLGTVALAVGRRPSGGPPGLLSDG